MIQANHSESINMDKINISPQSEQGLGNNNNNDNKQEIPTQESEESKMNKLKIEQENYKLEEQVEAMLNQSDRSLAYFEIITNLEPIPNADAIEVATILGWKVIVKKGLYKVNDMVVYVEIDSVLPPWEYFVNDGLDKRNFKIKTIKLRGQISAGYCIPIKELIKHPNKVLEFVYHADQEQQNDIGSIKQIIDKSDNDKIIQLQVGIDLTQFIGITKVVDFVYQPRGGNRVRSPNMNLVPFPGFIKKTDQTRIQNLSRFISQYNDVEFEVTEKLEGSSITAYHYKGKTGICSRNFQLVEYSHQMETSLIQDLDILEKLKNLNENIALQGEIIGPSIQGNIYNLQKSMYRVFDIWLIEKQRYASHQERVDLLEKLGLPWQKHGVPVFNNSFKFDSNMTVDSLLKLADGHTILKESRVKVLREGLVFKSKSLIGNSDNQHIISFKVISNEYLIKKNK
ncbi:hypothetical protein CYY_008347 [Polysphondylium violaceum]|uniref:RNA ligase domain-containing protein n=1 Tax=Polysphondylium violaceum TaxID=133409 RepID=A0A8J4PLS6_9MYCE|nr:hypothetical protein CYY_008347 [Polysphondylium violaceum]